MESEVKEEQFTVSIKGEGITIEKSVSADVARKMIDVIMGGPRAYEPVSEREVPVSKDSLAGARSAIASGARRMSLREFLHESQASSNPEKITAIGEYLREHEGKDEFTRDDIKGRFRQAGEAPPKNFSRDFSVATKNVWVADDANSPGSFFLTNTGRAAIKNKFSAEVKKATMQPTGRRRSRKAGTS